MASKASVFVSKLSIPGKFNDELSYVFSDALPVRGQDSVTLFGVFHLKNTGDLYHAIIKETVKNYLDFFHRSPRSVGTPLSDPDFDSNEFLFENAIQYTNERVTDCILAASQTASGGRTFDSKRVHFVLGAIFGDALFLSITGDEIHSMYIYPVFRKEGFSHYAMVNIDQGERDTHDNHRLFSSIVSGSLSVKGSTLVICNTAFLDYISVDQLKHATTNMATLTLSSYFEGLLSKANAKNDFSALFINPHYSGPVSTEKTRSAVPNSSMASLNSTAAGTKTILTPNFTSLLLSGLLRSIQRLLRWCAWIAPRIVSSFRSGWHNATARVVPLLRSGSKKGFSVSARSLRSWKVGSIQSSFISGMHSIRRRISGIANAESRALLVASITSFARRIPSALAGVITGRFKTLSRPSKILLTLSILFLLLFVQSVFSLQARQKEQKRAAVVQELFRIAELKSDLAEASLLYDNGERAGIILIESEAALANAIPITPAEKERLAASQKRIATLRAKISKITLIDRPTMVLDLSSAVPGIAQGRFAGSNTETPLLYTPEAVYAINPAKSTVAQIDTQAKLIGIRCAVSLNGRVTAFCSGEGNRLGLVDTKDQTVKSSAVDFHDNEKEMSRVALYNKRLYVLDMQSSMIYRHQLSGDSFGKGTAWLKDSAPFASARDIAVDGSIYVLDSPSHITRYSAGKKDSFSLPQLDPPLTDMQKIWTNDETQILTIMEPATRRIIMIDKKTGALKNQFVSDTFTDLKDVLVRKKDLLVLNGSAVYSVPLSSK